MRDGGFLKWWVSPTNHGVFPTKNDHFGVIWGVPPFKGNTHMFIESDVLIVFGDCCANYDFYEKELGFLAPVFFL